MTLLIFAINTIHEQLQEYIILHKLEIIGVFVLHNFDCFAKIHEKLYNK